MEEVAITQATQIMGKQTEVEEMVARKFAITAKRQGISLRTAQLNLKRHMVGEAKEARSLVEVKEEVIMTMAAVALMRATLKVTGEHHQETLSRHSKMHQVAGTILVEQTIIKNKSQ